MDVRGKVVFITGASAGIGLITAKRFAEAGAKLALVARSADLLEKLASELREQQAEVITIQTDMRDPEQVKRAIDAAVRHFGRIDILINNAGQAAAGNIADVDLENFQQIVELNLFGPLTAMQAVIPIMREHGGGIIINVSSMVSKMRIPSLGVYAATKSALNMLSDTARIELAPDKIRVISIFPRYTTTDFHANTLGKRSTQFERPSGSFPIDPPELVADKILFAAINEPEEQYMDS